MNAITFQLGTVTIELRDGVASFWTEPAGEPVLQMPVARLREILDTARLLNQAATETL